MGIVNVTPDSFSAGGEAFGPARAVDRAWRLKEEGADILDLGGESTRPGAPPVGAEEELARILPVLEGLKGIGIPLSIDTYKPVVMREAVRAGVGFINDINALQAEGAVAVAAALPAAVCLMHMQGEPRTMQRAPSYDDVVGEVHAFLARRVAAALQAGIARDRLTVDPGFGFGKGLEHNLALLRHLGRFADLGVPVLAGLSRKSMIGQITGRPVGERVFGSVAAAVLAVIGGARIVRVHDVRATRDALAVVAAFQETV